MRCRINGCGRRGECWVVRRNRRLYVCSKCRDELTAVYGWRLK